MDTNFQHGHGDPIIAEKQHFASCMTSLYAF